MKDFSFADKNLQNELNAVSVHKTLATNEVLMNPGDIIRYIPIVLKGSIRVVLQNHDGDEYFLYHLFPGESCALSLTCCQSQKVSEIKAVAEDETELLMIPVKYVDAWTKYPEWKKFISDTQAQRFTELLETIESVAFTKLDEQLWHYLIKRVQASGNNTLNITHQEIANELNSPREVITRLLNQLVRQKKIKLSRHAIEVHSAM